MVLARTGNPRTTRADAERSTGDDGLVGLAIEGGLLKLKVEPPGERWAFEGAPILDKDRVLVAMRQADVHPRAVIACFSRKDGRLLWQRFIAAGDTPSRPGWEVVSHNLLTLCGDTVYYNTNLGAIASLAARDGRVHWIKQYDRAREGDLSKLKGHFHRDLTPCVYHRGIVYCAPADTPFIFALDAVTGQTLWASDLAEDVVHLLGVSSGRLVASGDRLWWFDAASGEVVARWPEGPGAGLHGYGRGLIAADAVLWPTREQRIFVFDIATARQRREPIDLRPLDVRAGNLIVAGNHLIIAGAKEIVALGPPPAGRSEDAEADIAFLSVGLRGRP
jgi:outer membrane protein assembly factor BamB